MLKLPKVASFKTVTEFRNYLNGEGISIGLADHIKNDGSAALAQPVTCYGKRIGNRWAILPMEGWDCEKDGRPSRHTERRWLHFAESGAKLIYGTEAAAVMHSGRSNPNQLLVADHTADSLKFLCDKMRQVHERKYGTADDLMIGLQLTHSGRYSHPNEPFTLESKTAYSHPLLDKKFGNTAANVVTDDEVRDIVGHFIQAAEIAESAGFDFVDIKHAHGYLGHEFLTAFERPGKYGGSFENRTRFFREIAEGIKQRCSRLKISSRISLFDIFPFVKGGDNVGHPMEWKGRYPFAFGGDGTGMEMDPDLKEPAAFIRMMQQYGVELICASAGSPYYNPHLQRPAYFAVHDGYQTPENPFYNVERHQKSVRRIRELCPNILVVGSGYTCLQDYLPNAAEYALAHDETDFVGIGRMVLAYPNFCEDVLSGKPLDKRHICRTFGDCTNAPRTGLISGCYPLDEYYKNHEGAIKLRELKSRRPN